MPTVLVISLNFNPGHVSHLIASYKQFEDLGYSPCLLIHSDFIPFIPKDIRYIRDNERMKIKDISIALFLFPSIKNLTFIFKFKFKYKLSIYYVFHEPIEPLNVYFDLNFSIKQILKVFAANIVSTITTLFSNGVFLPSQKAYKLYENNVFYTNRKYYYLPLMFCDEFDNKKKPNRSYFSYIGTVAKDHSFEEFLDYVEWAISNKIFENKLRFLIATKSSLKENHRINKLASSGLIDIYEGTPLSNDQINECYMRSFAIWNAYSRTTQSGVLAKAFMFGTPAIILKKNISEFVIDGRNVISIENNTNKEEITNAIKRIIENHHSFEVSARDTFLSCFHYKCFNDKIKKIIE